LMGTCGVPDMVDGHTRHIDGAKTSARHNGDTGHMAFLMDEKAGWWRREGA
jgi:hypothetical protein